jgi:hypothetical protein
MPDAAECDANPAQEIGHHGVVNPQENDATKTS